MAIIISYGAPCFFQPKAIYMYVSWVDSHFSNDPCQSSRHLILYLNMHFFFWLVKRLKNSARLYRNDSNV